MKGQNESIELPKSNLHVSVMLKEVLKALRVDELAHSKKGFKIIDATVGLAGHAVEIVRRGGRLLGIDADINELDIARKVLESACPTPVNNRSFTSETSSETQPFILVRGNFVDLDTYARNYSFNNADGVLMDLGISSYQLMQLEKGFSFAKGNEPLDMRLDPIGQSVTAADLLNALNKKQLEMLFSGTLDHRDAVYLANKIVRKRASGKFILVHDLTDILETGFSKGKKLNPATLPFLALRMAVNNESENLSIVLPKAFELIKVGGRLVVISFHSGEDKIVKTFMNEVIGLNQAKYINKKPIQPSITEIQTNPRARSARMRVIEKT